MKRVTLVAGTHGYRGTVDPGAWWAPDSPFARFLVLHALPLASPRPFVWTTNLDGLGSDTFVDWRVAGENLFAYLVPPLCPDSRVRPDDCVVVAHSHGLQGVLFAAAAGLKIDCLVSVCSPIRRDMDVVAAQARPNIARWLHLYSDGTDSWQWLGTLADGVFGIVRKAARADRNDFAAGVGHAGLLEDQANQKLWIDRGWTDYMRGKS